VVLLEFSDGFRVQYESDKLNGIYNAIAMQIDDGEYDSEVVDHLEQAYLALTQAYELDSDAIAEALRDFRRIFEA
jgi:hypothetical protein